MREKEGYREKMALLDGYQELIPITVVAALLGRDRRTIKKHMKTKTLGNRIYVDKDYLARWLA